MAGVITAAAQFFQVNSTTAYAMAENTSSLLNPLTNDMVWTIGGSLTLASTSTTNGTATINGARILVLPATNFTGSATLTYTFTDGSQNNTSLISLLVTNIPPVANPDFYSVAENSGANALSPLVNDVLGTSGGVLGLVSVSPTNGTAVISGTNVLFTPSLNFVGTATIGYTITDTVGGTNTALITVTVNNTSADVSLTASAAPEPVGVSSNLVYSLTVSNAGPSTATGVTVSNLIPASVTFVSATGGATPSGGVLLLNFGPLAAGATGSAQVTVQPAVAGKLTNQFQVFGDQSDPVLTNNVATTVSTVTNPPAAPTQADVSLTVVPGTGPVTVGASQAYAITVSNAGPATASGVVISNRIPANETFYSVTGGGTTNNGVLLVNLGTLAAGAVSNVTLVVYPTLPPGLATGRLTKLCQVFASTTDPVLTNNSATVVSTVNLPVPGTPLTDTGGTDPSPVISTFDFGFGIGPIKDGYVGSSTFQTLTATPGDLILLIDAGGGNNPTNWAAVLRFFNPADPTGNNGLAATISQVFFATNYGGTGFAGFQLFPNTDFIPAITINTVNGITTVGGTFEEFGPAGIFLAGQTVEVVVIRHQPLHGFKSGRQRRAGAGRGGGQSGLYAHGQQCAYAICAEYRDGDRRHGKQPDSGQLHVCLGHGRSHAVRRRVAPEPRFAV